MDREFQTVRNPLDVGYDVLKGAAGLDPTMSKL
jgi:hypothetical protein